MEKVLMVFNNVLIIGIKKYMKFFYDLILIEYNIKYYLLKGF